MKALLVWMMIGWPSVLLADELIAEAGQKKVGAGDGTAEYIQRGRGLLAAKTDAEVLKVFGPDYVPAK